MPLSRSHGFSGCSKALLVVPWLVLTSLPTLGQRDVDPGPPWGFAGDRGAPSRDPNAGVNRPYGVETGATGTCGLDSQLHAGEGTFYPATGLGNCGFPPGSGDRLTAAMNQADYAGSATCGACVAVDGPGGSVTVRIDNRCPECRPGDIDLSPEAFSRLAAPVRGRVPIRWRYVACPVSGPLVYHFKMGSNPWWTAVQVRNHRTPIAGLAVREPGGGYRALRRFDYNYFVDEAGLGPGPYTFRVTDALGRVVEDRGVPLLNDADVRGAGQLPGCGG